MLCYFMGDEYYFFVEYDVSLFTMGDTLCGLFCVQTHDRRSFGSLSLRLCVVGGRWQSCKIASRLFFFSQSEKSRIIVRTVIVVSYFETLNTALDYFCFMYYRLS